MKPVRPLLRYHGGKWLLAPWIISHFPAHRVYVESYGGGASVLLRKERSYAEVYNDLDEDIVNLFRVARDNGPELKRVLALTPFARLEYYEAWQPTTTDDLERARRTVIRSFMGFGSAAATSIGGRTATGFRSNSNRSGTTPAHDWHHFSGTGFRTYTGETDGRRNRRTIPAGDWSTYGAALDCIVERLRGVVIENKDAIDVMLTHDGDKTLHYVDPPYPKETRDAGVDYRHELTTDDHRKLAETLATLRGAVILSGYACDLYDKELYPGWKRKEREHLADGARKRIEVLWLNPVAEKLMRNVQLEAFEK